MSADDAFAQRLRRLAREPAGNIHRIADALLVAHALRDAAETMTWDRAAWRHLTALVVAVDLLDDRDVDPRDGLSSTGFSPTGPAAREPATPSHHLHGCWPRPPL